jgi:hypothetical protein
MTPFNLAEATDQSSQSARFARPREEDRTPHPAMMVVVPAAAALYRASGLVP